jgi:hypothetical protein
VAEWSFLTNHARVLLCIAHDPGVRLRDIAAGGIARIGKLPLLGSLGLRPPEPGSATLSSRRLSFRVRFGCPARSGPRATTRRMVVRRHRPSGPLHHLGEVMLDDVRAGLPTDVLLLLQRPSTVRRATFVPL